MCLGNLYVGSTRNASFLSTKLTLTTINKLNLNYQKHHVQLFGAGVPKIDVTTYHINFLDNIVILLPRGVLVKGPRGVGPNKYKMAQI